MRGWLVVAALLTAIVCAASAALRLSSAGVGCSPWPECQQRSASPLPEPVAPAWHEPVRLAHRVSATAAGLMYLLALLFGWSRWTAAQRAAGVALLAVSVGLAWLGRYTPADKPAVVIGNLLGGHLLLALLTLLLATLWTANAGGTTADAPSARAGWRSLAGVLVVQIALGALVSARAAGAACEHGCSLAAVLTGAALAFDPTLGLAALPSAAATAIERQAVLVTHIALGALLLALGALAARRTRQRVRWLALGLAVAAAGWGTTMAIGAYPLPHAVTHSLLAAATLCAVVWTWQRSRAAPAVSAGEGARASSL